tara:strand:+ start:104 stop:433 length:330 start_codon:yes stop_codon:yes gene_type:complete
MNSASLLIGFLIVSLGWQLIANLLGPKFAQFIYRIRVNKLKDSGLTFTDQDQIDSWTKKTFESSYNYGLLILAMLCGMVAGGFGFPLIGFTRSTNLWSWIRVGTLCVSS